MSDAPAGASSPPPPPTALARALPILLATLCFGVILAVLAWRAVSQVPDTDERGQNWPLLATVCEGRGVLTTTPYERGPGRHPALAFRREAAGWALAEELIPAGLAPTTLGEIQLVLCVEAAQAVALPLCGAEDDPPATAQQAEVRLLAASTAALIARSTLGAERPPAGCWPADQPLPNLDAAITEWLVPFVNP